MAAAALADFVRATYFDRVICCYSRKNLHFLANARLNLEIRL